ncbi:hypothetical protein J0895_25235 [Phormidium pseudopriestleyi FRX01]|uniref:Uncharacterized protein n=1 Tax=Phormidium pseudopriestleyi FRX01 TaxID=1759528 RepID=A0ABS3FYV5_9CYAN|nr:hypothetical protein [Phormidium pseudopriestleyi]MBO0352327.1 hypothetical protein [Phormidium pseudopriestleyi FRX01]
MWKSFGRWHKDSLIHRRFRLNESENWIKAIAVLPGRSPLSNFVLCLPCQRSLLTTLGDRIEESHAKPLAALGDRRKERVKPTAIAIGSSGSQTRVKYHPNFQGENHEN